MADKDSKNQEEITKDIEAQNASTGGEEQGEKSSSQEGSSYWKDQFLRVTADFQNFKKRTERERGEFIKYAQVGVIEKLLPLLDDLERALTVKKTDSLSAEVKSWIDGLSLIDKEVQKFFSGLSIEEIPCVGQFDPRYHEALMHVEAEGKTEGDIVAVLSKGYKLGDTIIRHAKVTVAK